jgi:hypothetical protein
MSLCTLIYTHLFVIKICRVLSIFGFEMKCKHRAHFLIPTKGKNCGHGDGTKMSAQVEIMIMSNSTNQKEKVVSVIWSYNDA